ncbi:MAG: PilN domain-containing protein [Rickettsiales bacterium]
MTHDYFPPHDNFLGGETEREYDFTVHENAAETMLAALPSSPADVVAIFPPTSLPHFCPYVPAPSESAGGRKARQLSHLSLIGVEITPRYVRMCRRGRGKTRYVERPLRDCATWEELAERKGDVVAALRAGAKALNAPHNLVALALPMSASALGRASFRNMNGEALKDMASASPDFWRNALAKDVDLEHYRLCYDVVSRNAEHDAMELLFSGYRRDAGAFFEDVLARAGLRPALFDVREAALMRLATQIDASDASPSAVMQIGPEENHVIVAHNGLPVHKEIVISDWDRVALSGGDAHIMESVAGRYADEFRRATMEIQAASGSGFPVRALVSSCVPLAPSFVEKLRDALPEVRLYAVQRQDSPDGYKIAPLDDCSAAAAFSSDAAVTLIAGRTLLGKASHPYRDMGALNLYPYAKETGEAVTLRRKGFLAASVLALAVGSTLAALTLGMWTQKMRVASDLEEAKRLSAGYDQKLARAKELTGVTGKLKEIHALPDSLPLNQSHVMRALDDVNAVIPAGVWLDSFEYRFPRSVELKGNAYDDADILAFMSALSDGKAFSGITLKMMEAKEEKTASLPAGEEKGESRPTERPLKKFRVNAALREGNGS